MSTLSELVTLASNGQALRKLEAEIQPSLIRLRDTLVLQARDFAKAGSGNWDWLAKSKYGAFLYTGSISDGTSYFGVTFEGDFVFSAQDAYDCTLQVTLTPAQAADFPSVLVQAYALEKYAVKN